jgi:hypothetical protein
MLLGDWPVDSRLAVGALLGKIAERPGRWPRIAVIASRSL